ncbi:helix-turn-helix domain-containing protein [Paenibacillus humicola]|uniref:helix-turn-helix domain-containing protein n=1 Tax=Paenibacillus humicola TaxID=3110540 RepID=UPI00237A2608|nr:helix-turn-helix transcriptional regulator [Paenibacillus humicola]
MERYFDGNKLKQLRKSKGLSGRQLASMVDISQSYLSQFENGKSVPDVNILGSILSKLGVDLSSFFAGQEPLQNDSLHAKLLQFMESCRNLSIEEQKAFLELINKLIELAKTIEQSKINKDGS